MRCNANQGATETLYGNEPFLEDNMADPVAILGSSGRGRGVRGRARARTLSVGSQRKSFGSRSTSSRRSRATTRERLRGRPRARGKKGSRRGVKNNTTPLKVLESRIFDLPETDIVEEIELDKSLDENVDNEWIEDENVEVLQYEESENSSVSERSEFEEENGGGAGFEYSYGGRSGEFEEDLGVEGYINGDSDEEEGGGGGGGGGFTEIGPDEGLEFSSSEYSDEDNS